MALPSRVVHYEVKIAYLLYYLKRQPAVADRVERPNRGHEVDISYPAEAESFRAEVRAAVKNTSLKSLSPVSCRIGLISIPG